MQVVVNPEFTPEAHEKAKRVRSEDVLAVRGTLVHRSEETVNPNLATGAVELMAQELRVLNPSGCRRSRWTTTSSPPKPAVSATAISTSGGRAACVRSRSGTAC